MKKSVFIIMIFNYCLFAGAQDSFTISRPELYFSNKVLTIRYNINGNSNELVNIRLIVLSSLIDTIRPVHISGDIGKGISMGSGKSIVWNLEKDNIKLSDSVNVFLVGERYAPPVMETKSALQESFSRRNIILSSVVLPGSGQKKASGNKAYFILSGLTYGSLAASVFFTSRSAQFKKDYLDEMDPAENDILFEKWQSSYNRGKYFACGAAGTWVINIIWACIIPINDTFLGRAQVSVISSGKNELFLSARWNF